MRQGILMSRIARAAILTALALAFLGVGYLVEKGILDLISAGA